MIISNDGSYESNDELLQKFHDSRDNPIEVKCIKDDPPMCGFGKKLKSNDVVTINGTVYNQLGFCVCVPNECAFYKYEYFELV
jgi:hypothetical protein